jgi:hypothetical protein
VKAMKNQSAPLVSEVEPAVAPLASAAAPVAEEPPPFLGTWRNVYLFVLGELALTVVAFYVLTRWLS